MYRMVLYLLHFLVLFMSESDCQGFCQQNMPERVSISTWTQCLQCGPGSNWADTFVARCGNANSVCTVSIVCTTQTLRYFNLQCPIVRFCTNHGLTNLTDVNIDTSAAPRYQEVVCECTIFPFDSGALFLFSYYDELVPRDMIFKINGSVLSAGETTFAWKTNSAKLTLLTTKNFTIEGTCLIISADSSFNITCWKSASYITLSSTSSTLNGSVKTSAGPVTDIKPYTAEEKDTGEIDVIIIAVPTVIGALLILTTVIVLVYVKRRRRPNENKLRKQEQDQSFSNPVTEQIQGQQNNSENEERNFDISVNAYEKLNLYVNGKLAGEMYQQLDANKTEEYQEMYDVKRDYANQDRKITKQTDLQEAEHDHKQSKAEQLKEQGKGQGHNGNGGESDLEISPHEYQRLNMYINDNLAGEMYQQRQVDQTGEYREKNVASNVDKAVEPAFPEYTNVIKQDREQNDDVF